VLVEGVKLARQLAQTSAFAPFVGDAIQPGPEIQHDAAVGDAAVAAYVRDQAGTIYHGCVNDILRVASQVDNG
jgi:choline dehydrogenase-like flavoprotein